MKFILGLLLLPLGLMQMAPATGLPPGFAEEETSENQTPSRAEVNYQQLMLEAMLEQVETEEVVQLSLEDESSFIALQREALSNQPRGNLILLPGDGLHPNWPQGIAPLRLQLADYGWNTLALALPPYKPLGPPERTLPPGPLLLQMDESPAEEAPAEETDTTAFPGAFAEEDEAEETSETAPPDPAARLEAQQQAVQARLEAGLAHLGQGKRQVLVLQGEAVFWLLPWLQAGNWPATAALVLLDVQIPEGASAETLTRLLRALGQRPLLDIYDASSRAQEQQAQGRKAAYRRAGNDQAMQLDMSHAPALRHEGQADWLIQRIEGWLRSQNY